MAQIRPFRAIRYSQAGSSSFGKVLAPPYDVISTAQKKALLKSSPLNVIRLIIGNPSHEKHHSSDYAEARRVFAAWQKSEVLKRDEEPSVYIYRQVFKIGGKTYRRTGFVGLSQLTPFGKKRGGILAHEHTLSGPKADRLKLMKACHANFSCIFSLYPDKKGVGGLLRKIINRKPDVSVAFPTDIRNEIWKVSDSHWIAQLRNKMKNETLFIADGHHRYETALAYQAFRSQKNQKNFGNRAFDYVMMMFVAMNDPGLVILPTHRMLPHKFAASPALLLSRLSSLGEIHPYPKAPAGSAPWQWLAKLGEKRPTIGFSFDGKKIYALQFSSSVKKSELLLGLSDAQKGLDVTLLHRLILEPFFGISKEKVEEEIAFTSRAFEAVQRLKNKEFGLVFFLNPTRIDQLREVALKQERMPQKSTYFYPKLVTGLVFNGLDSF
jgi:uncharacterized protein (DUF1015 family)